MIVVNGHVIDLDNPPTSVVELQRLTTAFLALAKHVLGARSSGVLLLGMPIPGQEHDRFAAHFFGPCLSSRGLLAWGVPVVEELMNAQDTSKNGKPHP